VYTRCSDFSRSIVPFQKLVKAESLLSFSTQRIGQQYFRKNVIEECFGKCVVTKVKEQEPSILIASHIKPWIDSSDIEKVHGGNGLLLAPHIDKLFDSGLITFDDSRKIVISRILSIGVKKSWNIDVDSAFSLTKAQQNFMIFHQDNVFKH